MQGREHAPGVLAISATTFFALVPSSWIIEYVLRPLVVFELIANNAVHESGIPKTFCCARETFVHSVRYCSFE